MREELNDIDDLIGKVLAGEATVEEQQRVEKWAEERPENGQYFRHLTTIFEKAGTEQIQLQFDTDAAWSNVKRQLHFKKENNSRFLFPGSYAPLLRIAAGIAFLVGSTFFLYQWLRPSPQVASIVTDNKTVQDTLPDGSTAFLNKRSSLAYAYNAKEKTRNVTLRGEGFFDVKHEEEKQFILEAQEVLVKDIGTKFNVRAYPESDTVEVIVQSGEVQIYTLENAGLHLSEGEAGIYSKRLHSFSKLERADTNVLAYKTGLLSFNGTYLKSVVEKINDIYDANITLDNPALASCRLTVNFQGDSLDTIVDVIAETLKLTVTRNKDGIVLSGPGCN